MRTQILWRALFLQAIAWCLGISNHVATRRATGEFDQSSSEENELFI